MTGTTYTFQQKQAEEEATARAEEDFVNGLTVGNPYRSSSMLGQFYAKRMEELTGARGCIR